MVGTRRPATGSTARSAASSVPTPSRLGSPSSANITGVWNCCPSILTTVSPMTASAYNSRAHDLVPYALAVAVPYAPQRCNDEGKPENGTAHLLAQHSHQYPIDCTESDGTHNQVPDQHPTQVGRLTIATDNARTQELLRWALSASRHDQVPDDPADTECEHEEEPVQDGTGKSATLAGKLSVIALHVASSYSSSLNFKLKVLDFVKSGGLTLTVLPQFVGCTPPQR